ncbi:MAG: ATP-binding protein [Coriobacteriales bacterium]|nr:ATP-binding protein [Coriobacteriales bacterium]
MTDIFVFGDVSYDYALKHEAMEDGRDPYGAKAQHHRRWDVEESFTLKGGAHLLERLLERLMQPLGADIRLLSMTADPRHRAISAWEGIPRVVAPSSLSDNEVFLDADNSEHIFDAAYDDGKPKKVRRFFLKDYYGRILDDRITREDEPMGANRFAITTSDEDHICASDIIVGYNTDRDNRYFSGIDAAEAARKAAAFCAARLPKGSGPEAETQEGAQVDALIAAQTASPQGISALECLNASEGLESRVIVLRTTFERAQAPTAFLRELQGYPRLIERTILVLNIDELRHAGFPIEQGISWEKLVQQTVAALGQLREKVGDFLAVAVCFNHNGCLVSSKGEHRLFFYSSEIEGDFQPGAHQTFGEVIALQAAIVRELLTTSATGATEAGAAATEAALGATPGAADSSASPEAALSALRTALYQAARSGLVGIRKLKETGFVLKDYRCGSEQWKRSINRCVLEFPYLIVSEAMLAARQAQEGESVAGLRLPAEVTIPREILEQEDFSILHMSTRTIQELRKYCQDIVQHGFIKRERRRIPHLTFGGSLVYTRREIEELRVVRNAFRTYIRDTATSHPISFCVFGPPGAGKSFVVRQIEREVRREVATEFIECNLSQMDSEHDLVNIYHHVRDTGLQGRLPIVFFDEFDAQKNGQPYYWLKQFLAPMQDGKFYENGVTHYLGRAIFVFAGGINKSWEHFRRQAERDREAKGLDFLSRIRGYIDVLGLNPEIDEEPPCPPAPACLPPSSSAPVTSPASAVEELARFPFDSNGEFDKAALEVCIRRALLLRAVLEFKCGLGKDDDRYLPVDDAVVDAFVFVKEYRHGSRSLQTIIEMSSITRQHKSIDALCIMNNWQDLHVSEDFGRLLQNGYPV